MFDNRLANPLHGSQHPLALLFSSGLATRRRRHGHALRVDGLQKLLGFPDAVFEPVPANRQDALAECAHQIAHQHPIGRKMDAGLQSRRVQPGHREIQFALQPDNARLIFVSYRPAQLFMHFLHGLRRKPLCEIDQRAFSGHLDDFKVIAPAKRIVLYLPVIGGLRVFPQ